jgi:hypothetical protein
MVPIWGGSGDWTDDYVVEMVDVVGEGFGYAVQLHALVG